MFWFILLGLVALGIIGLAIHDEEPGWLIMLVLVALFALMFGMSSFDSNRTADVFQTQKAYIETHVPDSVIEDAALTQKKIELNDWLYKAKYNKERFGYFSVYPKIVLELEPIE